MTLPQKLLRNSCPLALSLGFMLLELGPIVRFGLWGLGIGIVLAGLALIALLRFKFPLPDRVSRMLKPAAFFLAGMALGWFCLFNYARNEHVQYSGVNPDSVVSAKASLIGDALRSRDGWRAQIRLDTVGDSRGVRASANLVCLAYFDSNQAFYAGSRLDLEHIQLKPLVGRGYAWQLGGTIVDVQKGGVLDRWRGGLLDACERALLAYPPGLRGFIMALLFGRQDELDPDMQQAFYRSGCAHLVALSGMHIALVASLLVQVLKPFVGIVGARIGGFLGAAWFIWLVGPFPSALRALAMFGLFQCGALLGRRYSVIAILCLTGPILGLINPSLPLSLGFQLSFWALFGIMICQDSLHGVLRRPLLPVLSLEISTGVSAQMCTAPLLWARGLRFFPQGIIAGIALAPLVLAFMAVSALALMLGLALGQGGNAWLEWPLQFLYRLILGIGAFFAG